MGHGDPVEGQSEGFGGGLLGLVRERWRIILVVALLTTLAAAAYVAVAPRTYTAEADILITPIARDNDALAGLGLLRESSDPTREIETASRLIPTVEVATRAAAKVPPEYMDDFLAVNATPVAQSSLVAVVVDASDPRAAAAWANAYAEAFVELRTEALRQRASAAVSSLQERLRASTNDSVQDQLSFELSQLQRVQEGNDPTVELETRATPPESPTSPRPALSIAAGLILGTILGVGAAFLLRRFDPRLRTEDQLRSVYPLPILARISAKGRRRGEAKSFPGAAAAGRDVSDLPILSSSAIEALWPLRALMPSPQSNGARAGALAVTSADDGEGKTTVALSLAYSLAVTGESVIFIEADLGRPTLAGALGVSAPHTTVDVLLGDSSLESALVTSDRLPPSLQLVLANPSRSAAAVSQDAFVASMAQLVEEASDLASYVIIEAPPLAKTVEALFLAENVDDVLIVVHLGRTRLSRLAELRELLTFNLSPTGFAVVSR